MGEDMNTLFKFFQKKEEPPDKGKGKGKAVGKLEPPELQVPELPAKRSRRTAGDVALEELAKLTIVVQQQKANIIALERVHAGASSSAVLDEIVSAADMMQIVSVDDIAQAEKDLEDEGAMGVLVDDTPEKAQLGVLIDACHGPADTPEKQAQLGQLVGDTPESAKAGARLGKAGASFGQLGGNAGREFGIQGKEFGILGAKYGSGGGRPRTLPPQDPSQPTANWRLRKAMDPKRREEKAADVLAFKKIVRQVLVSQGLTDDDATTPFFHQLRQNHFRGRKTRELMRLWKSSESDEKADRVKAFRPWDSGSTS